MRLDWSQFQTEIQEMEGDKNEKGRFLSFKFNFENSLSFSSFSFFLCVFSHWPCLSFSNNSKRYKTLPFIFIFFSLKIYFFRKNVFVFFFNIFCKFL